MRTGREAFQAFLLAVSTWNQVAFRAGRNMNDEPEPPGKRNPGEDRDQLRVLRVTRLRILHHPNAGEDPPANRDKDQQGVQKAADKAEPGQARGGGRGGGGFFRARGITGGGGGRAVLRQKIRGGKKNGKGEDKSLHGGMVGA